MKYIKFLLILTILLLLISGCGSLSKVSYPEQEKIAANYFEKAYDTKVLKVEVSKYKKPYKHPTLNKTMLYVGVVFMEKDPSLGVQFTIDDSGTVIDLVDKKQYEIRTKVSKILKKYRPDNPLNNYFSFAPGGIDGPMLQSFGNDTKLQIGVLSNKINVKKELETDHKIASEVQQLYYEYFQGSPTPFSIASVYYENGGFDLNKWLGQGEWAIFFRGEIEQGGLVSYLDEDKRGKKTYFSNNAKPTRVFQYSFSDNNDGKDFRKINLITPDQYLAEIRQNTIKNAESYEKARQKNTEKYKVKAMAEWADRLNLFVEGVK
jgi:hypothetical protein